VERRREIGDGVDNGFTEAQPGAGAAESIYGNGAMTSTRAMTDHTENEREKKKEETHLGPGIRHDAPLD
jgi:hypothetical protein